MGLSWANLIELADDRPILFELEPLGGEGRIFIAFGDEAMARVLVDARPDAHVITITARAMETLQSGEVFTVPLRELGVPGFHVGLVFAGETEFELIENLRAAGLADPSAPIEGIEEYLRHERNEVADCPRCRAGSHGGLATQAPRALIGARAGRGRSWRERVVRHPYLVMAGGLAICFVIALTIVYVGKDARKLASAKAPPEPSAQTQAWLVSDRMRQAQLDARDPEVLSLGLASTGEGPCPLAVTAPELLGTRPSGPAPQNGDDDAERFANQLEWVLLLIDEVDVLPGVASGVGPVNHRIYSGATVDDGGSSYRLTFVVDAWRGANSQYVPGRGDGTAVGVEPARASLRVRQSSRHGLHTAAHARALRRRTSAARSRRRSPIQSTRRDSARCHLRWRRSTGRNACLVTGDLDSSIWRRKPACPLAEEKALSRERLVARSRSPPKSMNSIARSSKNTASSSDARRAKREKSKTVSTSHGPRRASSYGCPPNPNGRWGGLRCCLLRWR